MTLFLEKAAKVRRVVDEVPWGSSTPLRVLPEKENDETGRGQRCQVDKKKSPFQPTNFC